MWAKIITIKRTKDLNYFSLCAFNLFNTRVSQFELNYWNKWTFPPHSNLLRNKAVRLVFFFVVQGYISPEYSKWWNHIVSIMSCVVLFLFLLMWSEQDEFPVVTVLLSVLSWIRFVAHPHPRPCVFTEWVCVVITLGSRLKCYVCGIMWHNVQTSATGRTEACNAQSACRSGRTCTSVVKCLPHIWARIV